MLLHNKTFRLALLKLFQTITYTWKNRLSIKNTVYYPNTTHPTGRMLAIDFSRVYQVSRSRKAPSVGTLNIFRSTFT